MSGEPFDIVVVSTDENPMFLPFWPLVAAAWHKFFDVDVCCAFVTERDEDDLLVSRMRRYGDVTLFRPPSAMRTGNFAKVARYYRAAQLEGVCLIHDMDTVPLSRWYYRDMAACRSPGHMLCIGGDAYDGTQHEGKFPVGGMTGEGDLFRKMLGSCVDCMRNLRVFDHKEALSAQSDVFSDESLVRALLHMYNVPTQRMPRALDIQQMWIDRSCWNIDKDRLMAGGYVECNMLRPMCDYPGELKPITKYIMGKTVPQLRRVFPGSGVRWKEALPC